MAEVKTFDNLQERIYRIENKISLFNTLILFLGILFVVASFLTFYLSSVQQMGSIYENMLILLLVGIIFFMLYFKKVIDKKKMRIKSLISIGTNFYNYSWKNNN